MGTAVLYWQSILYFMLTFIAVSALCNLAGWHCFFSVLIPLAPQLKYGCQTYRSKRFKIPSPTINSWALNLSLAAIPVVSENLRCLFLDNKY
jgi:hypothetical protein